MEKYHHSIEPIHQGKGREVIYRWDIFWSS